LPCSGGGAITNAGSLILTDVTVTGNSTSESGGTNAMVVGGGIENTSNLALILSTVTGNAASAVGGTTQNLALGGGIDNQGGTISLDRSTISGNFATATGNATGTNQAQGGGIRDFGQLTVTQSTINGNSVSATGSSAANSGIGGAIAMSTGPFGGTTALDRSTVTGNTVTVGTPVSSQGAGGIFSSAGNSLLSITSSTISGNSAASNANLVLAAQNNAVKNTIVSNPLGGGVNCSAVGSSHGFNIDDGATCGFTQPGDQQDTNPMLAATLGNNGGPTPTLALLAGSPAIDRGLSSVGETADQRGLARPSDFPAISNLALGDGTDVGAFEVQVPGAAPLVTAAADTPPDTSLSARLRKRKHKATFTFGATEAGSSFLCKLDKAPFTPCTSPVTFKKLPRGKHTYRVEAKYPAGNVDPTPSTFSFKFKR
ncbi:MAG: choice-of-anchor Q domain-containing protein, partial [Solirubrobacterales bacterium]